MSNRPHQPIGGFYRRMGLYDQAGGPAWLLRWKKNWEEIHIILLGMAFGSLIPIFFKSFPMFPSLNDFRLAMFFLGAWISVPAIIFPLLQFIARFRS